jgi:hypothetical protein
MSRTAPQVQQVFGQNLRLAGLCGEHRRPGGGAATLEIGSGRRLSPILAQNGEFGLIMRSFVNVGRGVRASQSQARRRRVYRSTVD